MALIKRVHSTLCKQQRERERETVNWHREPALGVNWLIRRVRICPSRPIAAGAPCRVGIPSGSRQSRDAVIRDRVGVIVLFCDGDKEPRRSGRALSEASSGPEPSLTIIRTTFLLFYDKFLQYVTKFATMTSGQRNKSVVYPEQRYGYMPCPMYDTGKSLTLPSTSISY